MGKEIEAAFRSATKVLLDRELGPLRDYEGYLMRHVPPDVAHKSAISERIIRAPGFAFYAATKKQMIGLEESLEWGKRHLGEKEARSLSLYNASKTLGGIRFYSPEVMDGENFCMEECGAIFYNSSYCYRSSAMAYDKYCAYSLWPRQSEHIFGSVWVFSCSFCINCYYSENLTRCFEVSNSTTCTDCYFCHNCENVHDSMFCFNAKNLRYAIGNREVGKEQYLQVKKRLLLEIASKLEKEKDFGHSIYDIGCPKKGK